MPSFLNDANSPIFQDNADILNLDPHNDFGVAASGKDARVVDGGITIPQHPQSRTINEPYDETSNSSIHDSDVSDSVPMNTNGNGTRPTSMSSLPNNKSLSNGNDSGYDADGPIKNDDAFANGITHTLPDRTVRSSKEAGVNGTANTNEMTHHSQHEESTTDYFTESSKSARHLGEDVRHQLQTIHSGSEAINANDHNASPTAFIPDSTPPNSSTHRLSSSPTYQAGAGSPSSSNLQNSHQNSQLRQRHTLEVPRASANRLAKDGPETSQATGRYSHPVAPVGSRRASLSLARRTTRSMQSEGPRDEIVPDEDAQRWAEALRQKRASKRKRKEEEDDDRVLVGTKVDESHANWVTAYNMLTGIRVSVSRTNAKLDRELTDEDFEVKQKSTFDITGNELVPSAKYDFKFKDYAPWVFRHLRSLFRLDPADYLMSLTGKYILSELGSPGKSGSFFYFSRDYKYIIKTIHHAEHKFLRKILREYYSHVKQNPNTLLSQFYGLHRVKLPYGKKIHFVVMNNLFPPHRDIHTTFDLKGSTIGRDYREEDLEKNPRATLKDLNWLRRKRTLELGLEKKRLFLEQLQRDVVLLKRLDIMDYSLLVGIHDLSRGNDENLRDKTLQVFNPGGEKSPEDEPQSVLLRTPSKLENARKARELRQMIRAERPVPLGQAFDKMPEVLTEGQSRPGFVFNEDDGGFRATHEDNAPADEIYYLGVIDCLTHYGMIKKIEHFWKGLTSDKTQISALPPAQYGDRFYNFVEGNTMSVEEAKREEARLKAQEITQSLESTIKPPKHHSIPPMPDHQPPAPPPGGRSPEGRETVEMASREAQRTEAAGMSEKHVPDRTLRAAVPYSDKRESLQREPILPLVQEAIETSDIRPETPPKNFMLPPTRAPPPTPPKPSSLADASFGFPNGTASRRLKTMASRESLNKSLPPLPKQEETDDSGVRMVA
ncbi:unnamed protein product [Clonostachys rhizophaga]|uniref:1-phosphatidylinositol-4-phosphate 5-kinase n=1 Tax=Clonostachys rhizophaga TaxID=160324 RepID=A0A9N9V8Q6_9HYPO|nr:unnamed protein product [Clonostachys rhizophaga]